jgi:CDP-6-deoxy-D-xylo-4-hexulose-3-dehydrase
MTSSRANALRQQILELVMGYYATAHGSNPFVPGETRVNYGGRVYDERELTNAVEAVLDFWLTTGPRVEAFEEGLARFLGVHHVLVVNSGSSANLVAMTALCSRRQERPLEPGDEVITAAVGFPTTVAPIVQNRLVPVFVDCELGTYNLDPGQLEPALSERTRAIFLAHTLGNPVEMEPVMAFARAHGLYVVEDICDALGTAYDGRLVGITSRPGRAERWSPTTRTWRASPRACGIGAGTAGAATTAPPPVRVDGGSSGKSPAWMSRMTTVTCSWR